MSNEYLTDDELEAIRRKYEWDTFDLNLILNPEAPVSQEPITDELRDRIEKVIFLLKVKLKYIEDVQKRRRRKALMEKLENYESFLGIRNNP
jgi:hypothetical protein